MVTMADVRDYAIATTSKALVYNLDRYLPDDHYREYFRWALSGENPRRDLFRRNIGVTQLGNLTAAMLWDVPGPGDWLTLVEHAVPVNVYQVFEVVSDNLGLGLAGKSHGETADQRKLLLDFNTAAASDLRYPSSVPATELLDHLKDPSENFSGFALSLTQRHQGLTVKEYENCKGIAAYDSLQRNIWSGLIANVESGRDVLAAIGETYSEPHVRAKTIERYKAVNDTLNSAFMSRDEVISNSRNAILVTPTLGYFAAVFAELLTSDPGYWRALDDGSAIATFDTASLLVRLQNDIGTGLLRMRDADRSDLFARLAKELPSSGGIIELLSRAAFHPLLNRFRKDIANGEFNICLHQLYEVNDLGEGLLILLDNLKFFSDMYRAQSASLERRLIWLKQRIHDRRIIELTRRFVRFHEKLYSHAYDTIDGDYAI
jgi:hypothetical protein